MVSIGARRADHACRRFRRHHTRAPCGSDDLAFSEDFDVEITAITAAGVPMSSGRASSRSARYAPFGRFARFATPHVVAGPARAARHATTCLVRPASRALRAWPTPVPRRHGPRAGVQQLMRQVARKGQMLRRSAALPVTCGAEWTALARTSRRPFSTTPARPAARLRPALRPRAPGRQTASRDHYLRRRRSTTFRGQQRARDPSSPLRRLHAARKSIDGRSPPTRARR